MKYTWKPPVCAVDDYVKFRRHNGAERYGYVRDIQTCYDRNGKHMHSYAVLQAGCERFQHVGDEAILWVGGQQ